MRNVRETSRFIWLISMLAEKKGRIASLLSRLTALEFPARMKPGLSDKFHALLQQIAEERDKEFDIIAEIHKVEERHEEHRAAHRLEKADRGYYDATGGDENFFENIKQRKGFGWFFHLLPKLGGDISERKQDLNLD